MEFSRGPRGTGGYEFIDSHGNLCSIQESSRGDKRCIWLGIDDPIIIDKSTAEVVPLPNNASILSRMELTRELAVTLIPMLQYFVATGFLPNDK